ncbi:MAG: DNA mismatch repair protein MutS [Erysipelotrichaceae bacterium]|nr:DNA mismatch repair protein MutS [Erysipelotrichaceae bacterium]
MENAEKYTPMMQQYLSVKKNLKDAIVFYRLGDFYEMFFDDARIASSELDLVLTGRNAGVEERVPMCGIPFHAYQGYAQKLVNRGYKVAIVEQMEDPAAAKGIVKRDVIRIITPGTQMDDGLDEKNSIQISSVTDTQVHFVLCMLDMSTGETTALKISRRPQTLCQTIMKYNIREVVVHEDFDAKCIQMIRDLGIVTISYCDQEEIKDQYLPLCESLKSDVLRNTYGLLLNYCEATSCQMLSHLQIVHLEDEHSYMNMDYSTLTNLELIHPLRTQSKSITLWNFLDQCNSAMGSRLLKKWVERPLVDEEVIDHRLDQVEVIMRNYELRMEAKEALSQIYDLERCIARIAYGSANAIDCTRLRKTLEQVPVLIRLFKDYPEFSALCDVDACEELCTELTRALVENPPVSLKDGGLFNEGYDTVLDELRTLSRQGKDWILAQEQIEKERTGIKTLKIGYNRVFGYYIEVSKGQVPLIKDEYGYIRKQTLVNNERYITQELKEKEDAILHAQEKSLRMEFELFTKMLAEMQKYLPALHKIAYVLSYLDCVTALACVSCEGGYVRPQFTSDVFDLKEGRHPILDASKKTRYISNSCYMDHNNSVLIITGPNMGGKSTYMRQVALIVIMAQIGCFVPADSLRMPIFDKVFTRIGASDDILSGQSTFMVEMMEANYALSNATDKSLILFDEIGRGTSTYDGMSIAQAMIEYIAVCIKAKTLFSTHYHELTSLEDELDNVKNVNVQVKEKNGEVTFMYRIIDGKASQSYGVNVARLANLPESVLERAKDLLSQYETEKKHVQQSLGFVEMSRPEPENQEIIDDLRHIDPNNCTPMQALQILSELKSKLK